MDGGFNQPAELFMDDDLDTRPLPDDTAPNADSRLSFNSRL